jgi:hypothetical protein
MTGHFVSVDMVCSFLSISQKLSRKNCGELGAHLGFPFAQSLAAALVDARFLRHSPALET